MNGRDLVIRLVLLLSYLALPACGSDGKSVGHDAALVDAGPKGVDAASAASVFDESQIHSFELTMPAQVWEDLNTNARDEKFVSASLRYQGQVLDTIGVRFKGAYGSLAFCFQGSQRVCDKLNLKLDFAEYLPKQRLFGLKRINLHAMEADPSKMHDAIGYKLFRDQEVYAPRMAYARVVVNGESLGLYAAIEAIDGQFTRNNFSEGGKGNLYKEVWPEHDVEAPYLAALTTNEHENPSVDKMLRFSQALTAAGDAGFRETIAAWTDVDHLMRYMAVARLIDHWDGIVAWYCGLDTAACANHNYYWYESSTEDKLWLVPWDLDHTFEEPSPIRTYFGMPDWDEVDADCQPIPIFFGITGRAPACDSLLNRMARLLWDEYAEASMRLLQGDFAQAAMDARIDSLAALIAAEVEADTLSTQTSAQWRAAVEELKRTIAAKRAHVEGKL